MCISLSDLHCGARVKKEKKLSSSFCRFLWGYGVCVSYLILNGIWCLLNSATKLSVFVIWLSCFLISADKVCARVEWASMSDLWG